jgi:peptide/nickel transport system permease protein
MTDRPDHPDHFPEDAGEETGGPVVSDVLMDKVPEAPPRSQWADVWQQFRSHKGALFGAGFFIFIVLAVTVGPLIWTVDPTYIDIRARNTGPSLAHPFGADQLGRDTLARMLAGGQVSIAVGITAMLLALFLGTLIGVLAGFFRWLDGPLMRLTDLFLALPLLPLLLVMVMLFRETLSSSFGPETGIFILIVVAIGITAWMPTASFAATCWRSRSASSCSRHDLSARRTRG